MKLNCVLLAVAMAAACGPADECADDGNFGTDLTLRSDGFHWEYVDTFNCIPGTVCPLKERVVPYDQNPFGSCVSIGAILFSGAKVTDE